MAMSGAPLLVPGVSTVPALVVPRMGPVRREGTPEGAGDLKAPACGADALPGPVDGCFAHSGCLFCFSKGATNLINVSPRVWLRSGSIP